jgi:membrane protease YdiL (CAAX protease family)
MNQQALSTVILRIIGLTYFYAALTAFVSGGVFTQIVSFNQISEEKNISLFAVLVSMIGIQSLFGLILMVFAKPISKFLFNENEKVNEEKTLTATTLIQAAVPLVGLYLFITYFPSFISTTIQWYKEKAGPPTGMPPQYGIAMANSTIMMVMSLFITLRSKSISHFLTRNTN